MIPFTCVVDKEKRIVKTFFFRCTSTVKIALARVYNQIGDVKVFPSILLLVANVSILNP